MLKEKGSYDPSNPLWDYQGQWQTNRLLSTLVSRKLVTQDSDGIYRPASDGPAFIISKTPVSGGRRKGRKNGAAKETTTVINNSDSPRTTMRKITPTELVAAMPTDLLKQELLRRGFSIERVSTLDDLVEWSGVR